MKTGHPQVSRHQATEVEKGQGLMEPRRFRPPWSVEELETCFVVKDNAGQKLACVYFEDEPGQRCLRETRRKKAYLC